MKSQEVLAGTLTQKNRVGYGKLLHFADTEESDHPQKYRTDRMFFNPKQAQGGTSGVRRPFSTEKMRARRGIDLPLAGTIPETSNELDWTMYIDSQARNGNGKAARYDFIAAHEKHPEIATPEVLMAIYRSMEQDHGRGAKEGFRAFLSEINVQGVLERMQGDLEYFLEYGLYNRALRTIEKLLLFSDAEAKRIESKIEKNASKIKIDDGEWQLFYGKAFSLCNKEDIERQTKELQKRKETDGVALEKTMSPKAVLSNQEIGGGNDSWGEIGESKVEEKIVTKGSLVAGIGLSYLELKVKLKKGEFIEVFSLIEETAEEHDYAPELGGAILVALENCSRLPDLTFNKEFLFLCKKVAELWGDQDRISMFQTVLRTLCDDREVESAEQCPEESELEVGFEQCMSRLVGDRDFRRAVRVVENAMKSPKIRDGFIENILNKMQSSEIFEKDKDFWLFYNQAYSYVSKEEAKKITLKGYKKEGKPDQEHLVESDREMDRFVQEVSSSFKSQDLENAIRIVRRATESPYIPKLFVKGVLSELTEKTEIDRDDNYWLFCKQAAYLCGDDEKARSISLPEVKYNAISPSMYPRTITPFMTSNDLDKNIKDLNKDLEIDQQRRAQISRDSGFIKKGDVSGRAEIYLNSMIPKILSRASIIPGSIKGAANKAKGAVVRLSGFFRRKQEEMRKAKNLSKIA